MKHYRLTITVDVVYTGNQKNISELEKELDVSGIKHRVSTDLHNSCVKNAFMAIHPNNTTASFEEIK